MAFQSCLDTTEAVSLESSLGLYLKPISKIKINVQLPKLNLPGQSISSWHVMEKIKATVRPDVFLYLKALKITSTVIKFEGELETKASSERALARLRGASSLKLSGFADRLQIRAAHAASSGPTRHDWEAFFRDAKGVNEMKPGERPDTIHLQEVPLRWFTDGGKSANPSEKLLQKAFGTFGKIRRLEVPPKIASESSNTFGKTASLHNDLLFEVYIQYEEYVEFAIAMDSLRGKKLLFKEHDGKVYSADIKVDFDRTKYLSDKCIKLRAAEEKKRNPELPDNDIKVPPKDETSNSLKDSKPQANTEKSLLLKAKEINWQSCEDHMKESKNLLKALLQKVEVSKRKREMNMNESDASCDQLESQKQQKKIKSVESSGKIQQPKEFKEENLEHTKLDVKSSSEKPAHKSDERHCKQICNEERTKLKSVQTHSSNNKKKDVTYMLNRKSKLHFSEEKSDRKRRSSDQRMKNTDRKVKGHEEKYRKDKHSQVHREDKHKKIQINLYGDKRDKEKLAMEQDAEKLRMKRTEMKLEEKRIKERLIQVHNETKKNKEKLLEHERVLKEKLLRNLKAREEQKLKTREELRKNLAGRKILTSVLGNANNSLHKKR